MIYANRTQLVREKLQTSLEPTQLEVIDNSALHAGHVGAQQGGSNLKVIIAANVFQGKPLLACHRMIYDALGDLMRGEIHALEINIVRP